MGNGYDLIPHRILVAINFYVVKGQDPGRFVSSVAKNDLLNAVLSADADCLRSLKQVVMYFYDRTPDACWGSVSKFSKWVKHGGVTGSPYSDYELKLVEKDANCEG